MKRILPLALAPLALAAFLLSRRKAEDVAALPPPRPRPPATLDAPVAFEAAAPRKTSTSPRLPPRTAFERLIDALRAKDRARAKEALEDLRLAFEPDPVPDAENAAILYKEAFAKMELIEESEADEELIQKAVDREDLTEAERARVKELRDRRREVVDLLRRAAERPRCDFGVKYEDGFHAELPHISPMIRASRFLLAEVELGGTPEAAAWAFRLSEAVADEPLMISQLVRSVCQGIATAGLESALSGAIPEALLRASFGAPSPESARAGLERSLLCELYAGAKTMLEDGPAAREGAFGQKAALLTSPDDPRAADDLAYYGESLRQLGDLVGRPYWEVRERLARVQEERVDQAPDWARMTRVAMPSFSRAARNQASAEARLGTSRLASQLRLYREARGDYPQSLEALGLDRLPLDPFTGRPYLYRREGEGFVVWSVGDDGLDGGGVSDLEDVPLRAKR
jgi:hypothetical protein